MSERRTFDVDIDVNAKVDKSKYGVRAMVYNSDTEKVLAHPSGYYIEWVPVDELTGICSFDYEYGEAKGFMKIDLLTNSSYDAFLSKDEVITAYEQTPDWSLLEDEEFVATLPHIGKHFDLIKMIKPKSIDDLSDALALIRPGKKHLLNSYLTDKERIRHQLYRRSANEQNFFKKSHSYSYAAMIICVMNQRSGKSRIIW